MKETVNLVAEKVQENYCPQPGMMATRTFWVAYPDWVCDYGHADERISRSWGRGKTKKAALAAAEQHA